MNNNNKVTSLGLLRGIAVLAVCFCHFGNPFSNGIVLPDLFEAFHEYGKYGVHIFFVISGFIIPFSLYKAKYELGDYFLFLYKRFLRLHPPYLIALLFTLLIAGASYYSKHLPNPETISTIFQSLFYIHAPGDNPVFWTLKVEAEYYMFIGLFFVLMTKFPRATLMLGIPILALLSLTVLTNYISLFSYITFFMIGTVGYLIYVKTTNNLYEYILLLSLIIFTYVFSELPATIVSSLTILVILTFRKTPSEILEFPGEISYSLYLIHFPIGVKLINILQRFVNPSFSILIFIGALIVCFFAGYVFWHFIEKPFARLSNNVKYGKAKTSFKNYSLKPD